MNKKCIFSLITCIFIFFIVTAESLPRHPAFIDISDHLLEFGCNENIHGHPIGGGVRYSRIITTGSYIVNSVQEFIEALNSANYGDTIFINTKAELDLTDHINLIIPDGLIIASNRGYKNFPGALIYCREIDAFPMLNTGNNVRISGCRIMGPDTLRRTLEMFIIRSQGKRYDTIPYSVGIYTNNDSLEVDNCELFNWSRSAIYLKKGANVGYIHNNYFHHNQRSGLGYGVEIDIGDAIIESNLFDWNRHCISGLGKKETSYEAYNNLILENANGHSFDMHGGTDRGDNTDIAGDTILIYNNTFLADYVLAILIRGKPRVKCLAENNIFYHDDQTKAIKQINNKGNMKIKKNKYIGGT